MCVNWTRWGCVTPACQNAESYAWSSFLPSYGKLNTCHGTTGSIPTEPVQPSRKYKFSMTHVVMDYQVTAMVSRFLSTSDANPMTDGTGSNLSKTEGAVEHLSEVESGTAVPPRKSFLQQLKPWSGVDREAPFFLTMSRSFTLFSCALHALGHNHLWPLHRTRRLSFQLRLPHQDYRCALSLA
jgi:hypothetical protein